MQHAGKHHCLSWRSTSSHRSQVNPAKYTGSISGLKTIIAEEGTKGVWKGVGPTLIGYSLQGMFKYGLYEIFKDYYMNLAGQEASDKYKGGIWLAGSASAEFFADIALCPLEMTKVKIQTSPAGTFPVPFGAAWAEMSRTKVETRFPFGSLIPLWSRQVRSSTLSIDNLPEFLLSDPVHDGQVLLFREDCPAFLYPRLHPAKGYL